MPSSPPIALADLIRDHWVSVYRSLVYLGCSDHDAEELTQETFLRALGALPQLAPGTNPRAWLVRIARNLFLDGYRRRQTVNFTGLPERAPLAAKSSGVSGLELAEEAGKVRRALAQLSETARAVFLLRAEAELSFAEIGAELGMSEEAARQQMRQARLRLQELMKPD